MSTDNRYTGQYILQLCVAWENDPTGIATSYDGMDG